jgi:hypothetical protein
MIEIALSDDRKSMRVTYEREGTWTAFSVTSAAEFRNALLDAASKMEDGGNDGEGPGVIGISDGMRIVLGFNRTDRHFYFNRRQVNVLTKTLKLAIEKHAELSAESSEGSGKSEPELFNAVKQVEWN